jgi:hypothetical protein
MLILEPLAASAELYFTELYSKYNPTRTTLNDWRITTNEANFDSLEIAFNPRQDQGIL